MLNNLIELPFFLSLSISLSLYLFCVLIFLKMFNAIIKTVMRNALRVMGASHVKLEPFRIINFSVERIKGDRASHIIVSASVTGEIATME